MVLRDSETYFGVSLESSVFVHEDYVWRLERILEGQYDLPVVEALVELCVLGSLEGEMPVVEVVGEWSCDEVAEFLDG